MPLSPNAASPAKLQTSFQNLSAAAKVLNNASDAFGDAVSKLDAALNSLNPGVEAWVTVSSSSDEHFPWQRSDERLGYAKTNGRWGLTLSTVTIDENEDSVETTGTWLFNDAPRNMRLRAIDHLPELIEALAKEAVRVAERVTEKANTATQLAVSISTIPEKGKP